MNTEATQFNITVVPQVGTAYYYDSATDEVMFSPLNNDGSFDVDDFYPVDDTLMEGETFFPPWHGVRTFTGIYKIIKQLNDK